jgi:type I restriction enzyme, S subunit
VSELSKGWLEVELSEVAELIRGVTYKKEQAINLPEEGFLPVLRATNITGSALTFNALVYVPAGSVSETQQLRTGDVVIASSSGSKEIVGKAGSFASSNFVGSFGAFCTGLRPSAFLSAGYFGFFFQTPSYRKSVSELSSGSNINNLKTNDLASQRFSLPPAAEQTRIVAKLEELLTDLDAGVAELKAAKKKLAQYRQSLLKAAVEGTLTAEWRAKNAATETGVQLLARILTERRARWEAKQLAKFKEQGKAPPKDWQKKYPEPVQPDTTELPELPQGWVWASVAQLSEFITSGSRGWADYYADTGATFIRSQNINKDWLDLSDIAFVNPPLGSEGARTRVQKDDVLLTITGANVGKAARVETELDEAYVSQHVALIRPIYASLAEVLHLCLTADAGGRGQLNKDAYGAGKPGLNLQQVAAVSVPIAGTSEFQALVEAVAIQFAAANAQDSAIAKALKQSTAQRQNILRAAFAGQLVPQDPNDEPASVLLARIRAERAQREADKKPRGRKPKDAI